MNAVTADQRPWSQPGDAVDAMAHISGELDDLSNIFNIGDFDLDPMQNGQQFEESVHTSHPETHPNTPFLDQGGHGTATHDFAKHNGFAMPPDMDTQFSAHEGQHDPGIYADNAMYHQQIPQHYQHLQQSPFPMPQPQQFQASGQIPPTPNSYEMHGEAGRFLQQQQQVIFEQQKQLRKLEQQRQLHQRAAQFTPMASPDGTPQYAIQAEFTTPGAYFSPLTSPALHAQLPPTSRPIVQGAPQGYFANPSTAPSSNAPSPVDLSNDVEMLDGAPDSSKRSRRKLVTPRSVGTMSANTRPRQSPIQKPQKRKSGLLTSIVPPKELDKMLAEGATQQMHPAAGVTQVMHQTFDSSESGSISPEPLSESLMGPPPRPTHSPSLNAQLHSGVPPHMYTSAKGAAATPKSILSMRSNQQYNSNQTQGSPSLGPVQSLDDLELPEAANKQALRPSLSKIDVAAAQGITNPRKTPKLGPSSTPSALRPDSASASPVASSFSPITASTPNALLRDKKLDSKTARGVKKRGSTSAATNSALASPALRPRISPSIKPLLPEGSNLHSPTHALLLAAKSNYQNLLEGNHLPGVSYPDSLSTGLTSKRTSHKVAEQGRRNRINEALKEMQSLIPSPSILAKQGSEEASGSKDDDRDSADANVAECDTKDSKESAAAKSNSSKAATVESANRYIRLLKESDMSQRAAILALKKENEEIRRRLAQATGTLPDAAMSSIQEVDVQSAQETSE